MAEILPSSFRFNTKETVDIIFSKILVANLFKDATFVAGQTFTDKYNERGGQIYVRKLGKVNVAEKNALDAGGLDLTHTQTEDKLILIQKTKTLSASEKCYELVDTLRASGKSVDKVSEVVESFKEKFQKWAMSRFLELPAEANATVVGGATRSSKTTKSTTYAGAVADILADREQIRVNGGNADVLVVAPEIESLFLLNAGTAGNAFVPETNESILRTGKIGTLFGMKVFTSNLIGAGVPIGGVDANAGWSAGCEYIIYDHNTFALCCDFLGLRLKDATDFFGSYAQIQGLCGGGVVDPALAVAKIYYVDADSIKILEGDTATVVVGETLQLHTLLSPINATSASYTWTTTVEAKATVSNKGLVTGVAAGDTIIKVKTANNKEATITITVEAAGD